MLSLSTGADLFNKGLDSKYFQFCGTIELYCCSVKAGIDNTEMSGVCVFTNKTLFTKQAVMNLAYGL